MSKDSTTHNPASREHIESEAELYLKKHFGYKSFRGGQLEVISALCEGHDSLVVMPTGGGKSMCYQIPALLMDGIAIIVSPLIALMQDQVDSLARVGIKSTYLNSTLSLEELNWRLEAIRSGEFKMVYVAPERFESQRFMDYVQQWRISFLAVDEAHCISEWGHDFRPSYTTITSLFKTIRRVPIIALTATATSEVRGDILKSLELRKPKLFIRGFDRPNLSYQTEECSNKFQRIVELVDEVKVGSIIIYCGTRKNVEETVGELRKAQLPAAYYHAGMKDDDRRLVQESFQSGEARVLVATNAFGMGIDKSDVRMVCHLDLTSTLEAYYQEAGRAGRDGQPAKCVLLYSRSDKDLQMYFIEMNFPDQEILNRLYHHLYDLAGVGIGEKPFTPIYQDDAQVANSLSLRNQHVSAGLRVLERAGVLRRGTTSGYAKIKFTASREYLREYFHRMKGPRRAVLEAIMRGIGSSALEEAQSFVLTDLLRKYSLDEQIFSSQVRALELSRLLTYEPPSSAGGITLIAERDQFPPINFPKYKERRELAERKLDVFLRFATTPDCKRNFILNYFQEESQEEKCGRCNSCLGTATKKVFITEREKFMERAILTLVAELDGRFGKMLIADVLMGLNTPKTIQYNMERSNVFGALKKEPRDKVVKAIRTALSDGLIKENPDLYPTVSLTGDGFRKIETVPKPLAIMFTRQETSAGLIEELRKFRQEQAIISEVSPTALLSDAGLLNIAKFFPKTLDDLKDVPLIGERFVTRFGLSTVKIIRMYLARDVANKEGALTKTIRDTLAEIEKGRSLHNLSQSRNLTPATVAQHVQELVELGKDIRREQFVGDELFQSVVEILGKNPYITLKDIRESLTGMEDFPTLRVAVAFARRQLGIKVIKNKKLRL